MKNNLILMTIVLSTGCLALTTTTDLPYNNTFAMLRSTTVQSVNHHVQRRSSENMIDTSLNTSNESIGTNVSLPMSSSSYTYNFFKDGSNLTRPQIKVVLTVVIIISLIMFIVAIFRFKNACRDQERQTIQTEIVPRRASQFSEPSSRRTSVGYYTRKYTQPPSGPFDEPLISNSAKKRYSVPTCDLLSKPATTTVLSVAPNRTSTIVTPTASHHQYVTPSCQTLTNVNKQHVPVGVKPIVRKSCSAIGISRCDDQTPLLTSELATAIKNSSNRTTRKYSLNAFVPLLRSSKPHPLSSLSSTTIAAVSNNSVGDENKSRTSVDIKSRRRVSLSSALRRNSFAKQSQETSPSTNIDPTSSLPTNQSTTLDSESSDQLSLLESKISTSKNPLRKKSSTITPIIASSTKAYRKDFMQKIERFRFIDDSASSTTTVTSPVESIDRINGHQPCSHLITSAIEQFDDYVRSRYHNTDEINCYIDRLNSDILTNGSYSDLNILNSSHDTIPIQQQKIYKPVNTIPSQSETNDYHQTIRNSAPMTILSSQHAKHAYPSDNSISRPTTIVTNGHSRSMDFQPITNNKSELHRPVTLSNTNNIYETSSSSLATLISTRSSTSLEFHDDTKPSGVLVDDDFLPMSSPVDEHFWDVTIPINHHRFPSKKNECFPNVGSSPDIEMKPFDTHASHSLSSSIEQPFSETSCDEDDDETSLNAQKFSIHEYKLKALQKPIVIHRATINPSIHSNESTNQINDSTAKSLQKPSHDESLLEKFALANLESVQIPIRSPPLRTSNTGDTILTSQTIYEEDDTQDSSTNDNASDESADNGEIDLVHEFELSQRQEEHQLSHSALWSTNDRDIFILQEDDFLSALVTTPTQTQQSNRPIPPSIMKITQNKSLDSIDEQSLTTTTPNSLRPKVRFNLDPQYEREREWNKVNKLLGNSVEWTDEFEV